MNLSEEFKTRLCIFENKTCLQAMNYEHFGIVSVKVMAAGSIPIVHRYGRSRVNTVSQLEEDIGHLYTGYDKCADLILRALAAGPLESKNS